MPRFITFRLKRGAPETHESPAAKKQKRNEEVVESTPAADSNTSLTSSTTTPVALVSDTALNASTIISVNNEHGFPLYKDFPDEIQTKIWKTFVPKPRVVLFRGKCNHKPGFTCWESAEIKTSAKPIPTAIQANFLARDTILKNHTVAFKGYSPHPILFNKDTDIVCFGSLSLGNYISKPLALKHPDNKIRFMAIELQDPMNYTSPYSRERYEEIAYRMCTIEKLYIVVPEGFANIHIIPGKIAADLQKFRKFSEDEVAFAATHKGRQMIRFTFPPRPWIHAVGQPIHNNWKMPEAFCITRAELMAIPTRKEIANATEKDAEVGTSNDH